MPYLSVCQKYSVLAVVTGFILSMLAEPAFAQQREGWVFFPNGAGDPVDLRITQMRPPFLKFADFNDDGVTDVFRANGREWYVSESGRSAWNPVNTSNISIRNLAVGDFECDGHADVIHVQDDKVMISRNAEGPLEEYATFFPLNSTQEWSISDLSVVDYNRDGCDDIVYIEHTDFRTAHVIFGPNAINALLGYFPVNVILAIKDAENYLWSHFVRNEEFDFAEMLLWDGAVWRICSSRAPIQQQVTINCVLTSNLVGALSNVRLGDFNNDGLSDFVFKSDEELKMKLGGSVANPTVTLRPFSGNFDHVAVGDFDDDGRYDDIFWWRDNPLIVDRPRGLVVRPVRRD